MKLVYFWMLFFLFFISVVNAADLEIEKFEKGNVIVAESGNPAVFDFVITNNLGEGVLVTAITATNVDTGTACDVTDLVVTSPGYSWQDGARMDGTLLANQLQIDTSTCFANIQSGQRYRVKMKIVYSGSSGISHTIEGEITGRAEA